MNEVPADFPHTLTGFGGDSNLNRSQHRAALKKTPVILIHGQAANVAHSKWGWLEMRKHLLDPPMETSDEKAKYAYQKCEIWAMDYFKENNEDVCYPYPVVQNIAKLRAFVDAVIEYLGVDRVDLICHSLGGMMTQAYLRGFEPAGAGSQQGVWKNANHRLNKVGSVVHLASCNYGLNTWSSSGEFQTGGSFEVNFHKFQDVVDDTPIGEKDTGKMISPVANWKVSTSTDTDLIPPGLVYVAVTAIGDGVDSQNPDTGRLLGAQLNKRVNLGSGWDAHSQIIKDHGVFREIVKYLNRYPPVAPATITADPASGSYSLPFSVSAKVDPAGNVLYQARRLAEQYQSGYIVEKVLQTLEGKLVPGASLSISDPGMWEVTFSSNQASDVKRQYGVGISLPTVEILTPNTPNFSGSLEVQAKASGGQLYWSKDGTLFEEGGTVRVTQSSTLYFIALQDGYASAIATRHYEKAIAWTEKACGTPNDHLIARRISLNDYLKVYGPKYHWVDSYWMYKISELWTDNPDAAPADDSVPEISLDVKSGEYHQPLRIKIQAADAQDPAPVIYWTTDGSTPTENSEHRANSVALAFETDGTRKVKCFAKDRAGHASPVLSRNYVLKLVQPQVKSSLASGEYTHEINCVLTAPEGVTVYYTLRGEEPTTTAPCFMGKKEFVFTEEGVHLIKVLAVKGSQKARGEFLYVLNPSVCRRPETAIAPAKGGAFLKVVQVTLTPNQEVSWTRYTTDGSNPASECAQEYTRPFTLAQSCVLKWCSEDKNGHREEVHSATFTITDQTETVLASQAERDGYVKADAHGLAAVVGACEQLAIGCGLDGMHSRAILHFDTSKLPDNINLTKAWLEIEAFEIQGDPFAKGPIKVDVKTGFFGKAAWVQADDFSASATATTVARIAAFQAGRGLSDAFSRRGLEAINKTGVTQFRLSLPGGLAKGNYLFLKRGALARLHVEYAAS